MQFTQLQKIKALLPVEVTAAFIGLQSILNGEKLDVGGFKGANDHHVIMAFLILLLIVSNILLLYKGGMRDWFSITFSTIGFLIWALNLDQIRWQDSISSLGLSPDVSIILLPILAIIYSLAAAIVSTNRSDASFDAGI